jgi:hypothetical protein
MIEPPETVTEVCDRWLAIAAKRGMFSADELTNMLLDIRNAHQQPLPVHISGLEPEGIAT